MQMLIIIGIAVLAAVLLWGAVAWWLSWQQSKTETRYVRAMRTLREAQARSKARADAVERGAHLPVAAPEKTRTVVRREEPGPDGEPKEPMVRRT